MKDCGCWCSCGRKCLVSEEYCQTCYVEHGHEARESGEFLENASYDEPDEVE